jgi:acyl carrier protein
MIQIDEIKNTMASCLRVDPSRISDATRDEDLMEWDSLGHVNLMMALEQAFGVQLEVEDFDTLKSVPAIVSFLNAKAAG